MVPCKSFTHRMSFLLNHLIEASVRGNPRSKGGKRDIMLNIPITKGKFTLTLKNFHFSKLL